MKRSFTKSFKMQAVEKALSRGEDVTLTEIANSLNIGKSTLNAWITKARNQEFDLIEKSSMTKEKRPQEWTQEERFNLIVSCAQLTDEALNEYCRKQGVYPHHVEQWKRDFINGGEQKSSVVSPAEIRSIKNENKTLKKELNRKDKALAETAALLVLQKKVQNIWGNDAEDN